MSEASSPGAASLAAGRRERRTAEMRERIFRAAIELVAERGLESVTIEQITERADVGKGTFFNYFASKEAVLTHFGGVQVERLHEALQAGEIAGTPRERLLRIFEVLADYPGLTRDLARALFVSALRDDQYTQTDGRNIWHIRDILAEVIAEGRAHGDFRNDGDVPESALFLLGQYFLALLAWCTGFTDEALPEVVRRYACMGLDALECRR